METFSDWEAESVPVVRAILTALDQCDRTYERRWAPALLSHADQLSAAATTVRLWSTDHPCPLSNFDGQLGRISLAYAYAGVSFESVARGSSITWLVVDRELRHLRDVVAEFCNMLHEQMGHLSRQ